MDQEKPGTKKLMTCSMGCLLTLILLLFLTISGLVGLRYFIRNQATQNFTQEQIEQMDRFAKEPIGVPKDWSVVEPYSRNLIAQTENIFRNFSRITTILCENRKSIQEKVLLGHPLENDERQMLKKAVEENRELIETIRSAVQLPDYDLGVFAYLRKKDPTGSTPSEIDFIHLLTLNALLAAEEGREEEALLNALLILRFAKRHPASTLIVHLFGFIAVRNGSQVLAGLSEMTENREILEKTLEDMPTLESRILPNLLENIIVQDSYGMLRDEYRMGKPVDLSPDQTGKNLMQNVLLAASNQDATNKWVLMGHYLDAPLFGTVLFEILYSITTPNFLEPQIREKHACTMYRLAQIKIASRIHELETGQQVVHPDEIDSILPDGIPDDPFIGSPFRMHPDGGLFYSFGPDQVNDRAALLYDPTNGTISDGDIFYPSRSDSRAPSFQTE